MEDISPGVMLPESADGGGRLVVGSDPTYPTHPDGLHFHLPVPVQYTTSVPLPSRGKQRRQRRYVGVSAGIAERAFSCAV